MSASCNGANCVGFAEVGTSTTLTFSSTGLSGSTIYRFRVRAYDNAGNNGDYSPVAQATTAAATNDTAAPSPSTAATATAVDAGRINLSWSGATDTGGSGPASYRIERCAGSTCTNFAQVGTSTTTSYSSTGLTQSTAYRFRIKSVDGAGNASSTYSPIAAATTPADSALPTAPTTATATAVDAGRINLSWSGATDTGGSALASYRIERCHVRRDVHRARQLADDADLIRGAERFTEVPAWLPVNAAPVIRSCPKRASRS